MARLHNSPQPEVRLSALQRWAEDLETRAPKGVESARPSVLTAAHNLDLRNYFDLCAFARNLSTPSSIRSIAAELLFPVRRAVERNVRSSIRSASRLSEPGSFWPILLKGSIYGRSNKQGISIRFALFTCDATSLCQSRCYAHDLLDASKNAIVRGVINAFIAGEFEKEPKLRPIILDGLARHTRQAVRLSLAQRWTSTEGEQSPAYIRFSHVGEMPAFPNFANALAAQIASLSSERVASVIYTRHRRAKDLNQRLFVVNFTLDASSLERSSWAPTGSRLVFSAFDGQTSSLAEVNFLEHHRWQHFPQVGEGNVCPATTTSATERTCRSFLCSTCFRKV